jgi:HD-like signal output (HDOD) protein
MSDQNPDEALFAGLVHDIGKFYLLSRASRHADLVANGDELERLLMDWHASIGEAVLTTLGVPDEVLSAVGEHELGGYAMPPRSLADIVVLANRAAHARDESASEGVLPEFPEPMLFDLLQTHESEIQALVSILRG